MTYRRPGSIGEKVAGQVARVMEDAHDLHGVLALLVKDEVPRPSYRARSRSSLSAELEMVDADGPGSGKGFGAGSIRVLADVHLCLIDECSIPRGGAEPKLFQTPSQDRNEVSPCRTRELYLVLAITHVWFRRWLLLAPDA